MKKSAERMCVATRMMKDKISLIRIVNYQGEVHIDLSQYAPGRGAYLSKTNEALETAKKKNLLSRALKVKVPEEVYSELERLING